MYPQTRDQWLKALETLPEIHFTGKIPAVYFGHGQPMLIWPDDTFRQRDDDMYRSMGPNSPMANFLKDFGPALLRKYHPKAIVVFSAHWETDDEIQVTDYPDENPLFLDYYGFPASLYSHEVTKFRSRGDTELSQKIVQLLKEQNISARTLSREESRGVDGRKMEAKGFDHGVFVPFKLMFGDELDIPVVQVSIDSSLDPEKNWNVGKALDRLRSEGVLVLAGGLIIHTFQDFSAFSEKNAKPVYKEFDRAVNDASLVSDPIARREALLSLVKHPGFRLAHPREEHFVPIYVAAGCGDEGGSRVVSSIYGAITAFFGVYPA